jgi:hypothetical protein
VTIVQQSVHASFLFDAVNGPSSEKASRLLCDIPVAFVPGSHHGWLVKAKSECLLPLLRTLVEERAGERRLQANPQPFMSKPWAVIMP